MMSHFRRKFQHKIKATKERRERQDAAPPLSERVPELKSLRLEIYETIEGEEIPGTRRGRPIPVRHAPAWFELPCIEAKCEGGGHDITKTIMRRLKEGREEFDGKHACKGTVEDEPCGRTLHFEATATYADRPAKAS